MNFTYTRFNQPAVHICYCLLLHKSMCDMQVLKKCMPKNAAPREQHDAREQRGVGERHDARERSDRGEQRTRDSKGETVSDQNKGVSADNCLGERYNL